MYHYIEAFKLPENKISEYCNTPKDSKIKTTIIIFHKIIHIIYISEVHESILFHVIERGVQISNCDPFP